MSADGTAPVGLPIPEWTPPWPASAPTYVRLTPTHLRPRGCAEQVARKARPDVFTDERSPWEPTGLGSFPLGLVRDALLILLDEAGAGAELPARERVRAAIDRAIEASWEDWSPDSRASIEAGVVGYLEVLESLRADGSLPETRVFPDLVALQDPDGERVELWAWAIHHVGIDGALREAHLLRWRGAATVPLQEAEAALVAHVAGSGAIAEHAKWYQRFEPKRGLTQPPPAQQVRVRIVGLLDASTDVRFDGTPEQAAAATVHARPLAPRPAGRRSDEPERWLRRLQRPTRVRRPVADARPAGRHRLLGTHPVDLAVRAVDPPCMPAPAPPGQGPRPAPHAQGRQPRAHPRHSGARLARCRARARPRLLGCRPAGHRRR